MKKITFTLLCLLFFTFSVHSQTTIACQFTDASGYTYEGGKWKQSRFFLGKPFFIKINSDGVINVSSLKGIEMDFKPQCNRPFPSVRPDLIVCHDAITTLTLSTKTLEGAMSALGGAAQPNSTKKDDMAISIFSCQSM